MGTSARSSNNSIARADLPTALWVPEIGSTSAVEDMASASESHSAGCGAQPNNHKAPPISAAVNNISAAPMPKT